MSNLFSFIFILLVSFEVSARSEFYQLKGEYKLNASLDTAIKFLLSWSEENGEIKGTYSDNYFTNDSKLIGSVRKEGRVLSVELPEAKRGVKTLTFQTSNKKVDKGIVTIPVSIRANDSKGKPLEKSSVKADISPRRMVAQMQEEQCREGFGALAGFCGIYEGLISESVDRQNKCNLLFADSVKLELDPNAQLTLYLGEVEEVFDTPGHLIGRLTMNPGTTRIDIMSRSCRNLPGVDSRNDYCKRLNLTGEFSSIGNNKHFKGEYTIFDEGTKNTCIYSLSMDQ
jgi:hypothetical protein